MTRDLERRVRRLEALRETARVQGVHVVFVPDDLPDGDDPAAFLAACREQAGAAQLLVVEFVEPSSCP